MILGKIRTTLMGLYVRFVTKSPLVSVLVITAITIMLALQMARFEDHIASDLETYLPKGAQESETLKRITKHWATNVEIIFIETDNAYYPEIKDNITHRRILREISYLEGNETWGGLNPDRTDRGVIDDIAYSISISILIKEINSSGPRMANVLEDHMAENLAEIVGGEDVNITSADDEALKGFGHYDIPQTQQQINQIISQIPQNVLDAMVADTNDDGIWDTSYIMFGVVDDVEDKDLIERVDAMMANRPMKNTRMEQTGIIPIMMEVTDEAMLQLVLTMPWAALFTMGVIFYFHRSLKIILIAGIPLLYTLIWTFGLIVLMDVMVSPIIVAAIPMLIGLGVDYSLHLSNRIAEFQREENEEVHEAIKDSLLTTGKAIFLSVITTIIGFASLLTSTLEPIVMMGIALITGIMSAYVLTLILVPNLVILLKYRKTDLPGWRRFSEYPVRFRWPIVIFVIIITIVSLTQVAIMTGTETERPKERDTGLETITTIRKFSSLWSSGQSALVLIEGDAPYVLKELPLLDGIDMLENGAGTQAGINDIRLVNATCIVDVFKSIALNISWTTTEGGINDTFIPPILRPIWKQISQIIGNNTKQYYLIMTYWDFIHWLPDEQLRREAIDIFYDSLTEELRAMLVNDDYSMTLMIVNFPYLGVGETERIIDDINKVVANVNPNMQDGQATKATGLAALILIGNEAIVQSMRGTLWLCLILVFLSLTFIFGSLRLGVITMIPILLVVAWQPLTMASVSGFTGGATLNMMTAMIGSLVIGTGIDFSCHISARLREEGETIQGVKKTTEHTGQTIAEATLTTVAGLSGGLAVTWFRGFFFIIMALILYAMFAGLVLLPAIYAILIKHNEKKYRKYLKPEGADGDVIEAEVIEP